VCCGMMAPQIPPLPKQHFKDNGDSQDLSRNKELFYILFVILSVKEIPSMEICGLRGR